MPIIFTSLENKITMAEHRQFLILNITILLLLILLSSSNAYQLFRDSSNSIRPVKYHMLNDPDRQADRMKQYHNTVAQLRLWRRYADEFIDDEEGTLPETVHQYKSPEYYKR